MRYTNHVIIKKKSIVIIIAIAIFLPFQAQTINYNEQSFNNPPTTSKIHVWWHWLDGNITKDGITKDLQAMKEQGVAQATIYNVGFFGSYNPEVAKIKFASIEWYEMFRWALSEANRIGITIGINNCDGWNSGGPWITPEMSMKQFVYTKTIVTGGKEISLVLQEPYALENFYKDVSVVAYKTNESLNSYRLASPKVTLNNKSDALVLMDGDPVSAVTVVRGDFIQVSFSSPFEFDNIAINPRKPYTWCNMNTYLSKYTISTSDDGKDFSKLKDITVMGITNTTYVPVPKSRAKFVRITLDGLDEKDESFLPFTISEVELLKDKELATYSPNIPYIAEKISSARAADEKCFYQKAVHVKGIIHSKDVINLTGKMRTDGTLKWDAPEGNWAILRFGFTTTGRVNGPATIEGRGLECDKMDTAALDFHFKSFAQKLIDIAGDLSGNTFKFILLDSWECGHQNWTAGFQDEFERRRGYSLIPYLPLLCGNATNSPEESEAVLYDFRKTIAELIETNYYGRFTKLCHKQKLDFHAEVIYGGSDCPPLDVMKTNSLVDVPMCEFWANESLETFQPNYLATNAAVGYNKPLIAAESYTSMASYSEYPSMLKPYGDKAYCSGINQFVLHDFVHQPTDNKPGFTLSQFGSHFNRNNLYWNQISQWLTYQARIQYILQKGNSTPDVLYFIGDQLPQYYSPGKSNDLPFGYLQTVINFDLLKNNTNIKNGKIQLNHKGSYSLLCLPEFQYMNYETLLRISELVEQGAIIVGSKPLHTLSFNDIKNHKTEFKLLADKIWGNVDGKTVTENSFGQGKVFSGIAVAEVLKRIGLASDFSTNIPDAGTFGFIHKQVNDTDIYFVANQLNKAVNTECIFRIGEKIPEIWSPENGCVSKIDVFNIENGQIRVPTSFKPYESKLFVFKKGLPKSYINRITKDEVHIFPLLTPSSEPVPLIEIDGNATFVTNCLTGNYLFYFNTGKTIESKLTQPEEFVITDFSGKIEFEPEYPDTIAPIAITSLKSLTEFENPDIRYFAGNANYRLKFNVPESFISTKNPVVLNIGNFVAVAEVWLNGKELGKLWNPGSELIVSGLLKIKNELVVKVANVYRNRFIGDFIQYGKIKNLWTTSPIETLLDKDKPLLPSGLLGPLQLWIKNEQQVRF